MSEVEQHCCLPKCVRYRSVFRRDPPSNVVNNVDNNAYYGGEDLSSPREGVGSTIRREIRNFFSSEPSVVAWKRRQDALGLR